MAYTFIQLNKLMKYNVHKGGWTLEPSGPTTTCIFGTCLFIPTKCLIVRNESGDIFAPNCGKFSDIFSPLQEMALMSSIEQVIEDIKAIVSIVTEDSFTHTRR